MDIAQQRAALDAFGYKDQRELNRLCKQDTTTRARSAHSMDDTLYAAAQARCDAVDQAHGAQAPRWLQGESLTQYRVRLLQRHQAHSPDWKAANLRVIAADPKALDVAEAKIYADSLHAGTHPKNEPGMPLIGKTCRDEMGRMVTTFSGDPLEAWRPFMGAGIRHLTAINRHPAGAA